MSRNSRTTQSPYEYIDRNVEAVQSEQDKPPVNRERNLKDIENGIVNDTLTLIDMLDGTTLRSRHLLSEERESPQPFDAALFLDKSGRPVRQLMHDLWDSVTDKPEPKSLFLNIDKRPWLRAMGFKDGEEYNLDDIDPSMVTLDAVDPRYLQRELTALRALYLNPSDFKEIDEENLEETWEMPTQLDGKTIAIIDEVKSSGNTLRIAVELLRRAFPKAHFEGIWWSDPGTVSWQGGEDVNFKKQWAARVVPPWYDARKESGRGVGDIDIPYSTTSPSKAQRIGRSVLSAPERDSTGSYVSHRNLSAVIRRDVAALADRYKSRELDDYKPSIDLDDDLYDRRVEQYYQEPAETVYKRWRSER
jgi:hypothetical protein